MTDGACSAHVSAHLIRLPLPDTHLRACYRQPIPKQQRVQGQS